MLLDVSYNSMHIVVVGWVLKITRVVVVVVSTASVSMGGCWEFHVHHVLVREVFWFAVIFWWSMRSVSHKVSIWKAVIVHVAVCKLLLVLVYFVKFGTHVCIGTSSSNLATKDVSSLRGSSRLSVSSHRVWASHISLIDFSDHLHLVSIIHDKLLAIYGISSIDRPHSLTSSSSSTTSRTLEHDLTLRRDGRYLVVIFLNWRQIYINSINLTLLIKIRLYYALVCCKLAIRLGQFIIIYEALW